MENNHGHANTAEKVQILTYAMYVATDDELKPKSFNQNKDFISNECWRMIMEGNRKRIDGKYEEEKEQNKTNNTKYKKR